MNINASYKTLGVSPGSSLEKIKSAYKAQVKTYHPDLYENQKNQQEDAKNKLIQANLAYKNICTHLDSQKENQEKPLSPEPFYQEYVKYHSLNSLKKQAESDSTSRPFALQKSAPELLPELLMDKRYTLARIRANERITAKIEHMTQTENEIATYKKLINKQYFSKQYYEIEGDKKVKFHKLKKILSEINNKK